MSSKDQREYLEKQLDQFIARFDADRERHKKLGLLLKALTVSLAALVTVLLGWKVSGSTPPLFANIALVLGAAITVVSAYEAFFDPRALWVRETVVSARLRDLKRDLAYTVASAKEGEPDTEALEAIKGRLDAVLEESLKTWLRLRGQDDQQVRPPTPK